VSNPSASRQVYDKKVSLCYNQFFVARRQQMKNSIIWILAMLFLSGLLNAQTLDEILAKNYQAHGGLDKLKAMTAIKMSGKIVIPAQEMEMPMVMWQKNPDKIRIESTFQDKLIVQAYDGRKAWWIMPFMAPDPREMSPEQRAQLAEQADFENPLAVYREKGYRLELLGEENLEGTPVFKLKLTRTDGREIYFYLDVASGITMKSAMKSKSGASETMKEIIFTDYKPVNGWLVPFHIDNKTDGKTQVQLIMTTIEINPVIDDALFVMPLKKEEAMAAGQK
jgi:outer membrane lipoprotein-sorting protein